MFRSCYPGNTSAIVYRNHKRNTQARFYDNFSSKSRRQTGRFPVNSIPFNNSTHPSVNSQINTPEVTVFKLAFTVENFWPVSLTFISLTVEPSLVLEYTFVSCLSYCRFQPSTLSASRRKCSKSSAFAVRTSPSCIESTSQSLPTIFNSGSITYRAEGRFTEHRENELKTGINFKDGCQN